MCLRTPLSPPPPTRPSWGGGKSDGQRDPHPRLGRGPNTLFKGPIHTPLSNQNASNQGAGPVIGQDWAPAAPRQARGRLRADPKFTRRRTSHASTRSIECLLLRSFAASRPEHSPPSCFLRFASPGAICTGLLFCLGDVGSQCLGRFPANAAAVETRAWAFKNHLSKPGVCSPG